MYGAEVWKIPTRDIKFYLQKWTCYGGRQAHQGWKKVKNENIKEIMGVKGKPDIIEKKDYNGMAMSRGCQRRKYQN
jgi:hypothetical protein